jgi:hypothetical protein
VQRLLGKTFLHFAIALDPFSLMIFFRRFAARRFISADRCSGVTLCQRLATRCWPRPASHPYGRAPDATLLTGALKMFRQVNYFECLI